MSPYGITRTVSESFEGTIRTPDPKTPPRHLPLVSQLENPDYQTIDIPDYVLTSPSETESLPDTIRLEYETPSPKDSVYSGSPNEMIDTAMEPLATKTTDNVGKLLLRSSL